MTDLKRCLSHFSAKYGFTCYQKKNALEKQLKQWVIALYNLLTAAFTSLKLRLLVHSTSRF